MAIQSTVENSSTDADKRKRLDSFEASLHQYSTVERLEMIDRIVRSLTSMAIHFDDRATSQKRQLADLLNDLSKRPHEPDPYVGLSHDEVLYDKLQ